MMKFRVTYPRMNDHIFVVEAENPVQAIARAEIKRKEIYIASSFNVRTEEYKDASQDTKQVI